MEKPKKAKLNSTDSDWLAELNDAQRKQVMAGLNDAEKGRVLSSKEFWKKLKNG